jgi:hypothetical protein
MAPMGESWEHVLSLNNNIRSIRRFYLTLARIRDAQ